MYAMDTAVHFEHRTETRRSRAEIRRALRTSTPQPATQPAPVPATAESPVHEFLD